MFIDTLTWKIVSDNLTSQESYFAKEKYEVVYLLTSNAPFAALIKFVIKAIQMLLLLLKAVLKKFLLREGLVSLQLSLNRLHQGIKSYLYRLIYPRNFSLYLIRPLPFYPLRKRLR